MASTVVVPPTRVARQGGYRAACRETAIARHQGVAKHQRLRVGDEAGRSYHRKRLAGGQLRGTCVEDHGQRIAVRERRVAGRDVQRTGWKSFPLPVAAIAFRAVLARVALSPLTTP